MCTVLGRDMSHRKKKCHIPAREPFHAICISRGKGQLWTYLGIIKLHMLKAVDLLEPKISGASRVKPSSRSLLSHISNGFR